MRDTAEHPDYEGETARSARFERVLAIVDRAQLRHYPDRGCEAIVGLDELCGRPARLRPDGAFEKCTECGRTSVAFSALLEQLDDEIPDPAGPTRDLELRLAQGCPQGGVQEQVTIALRHLGQNPGRDQVIDALRGLAEAFRGRDALNRAGARYEAAERLKALGVATGEAAQLVGAAFQDSRTSNGFVSDELQGRAVSLADPEPWPEPVDGSELADEIAATFERHVILPQGADVALTLWALHAHATDAADVSPILALTSPEKRCGKSTTLILLSALVPRPLMVSGLTSAVLFRAVEKYRPSVLVDEADTLLAEREELRAMVNAGHRRETAMVPRCEGDSHEPRLFSTWCPKAIALIGRLPGTLEDRSIPIALRRKAPGEVVARLRLDRLRDHETKRRRAWRWGQDHMDELRAADPAVPRELHDRAQDNWRPLLAAADAIGGEWPARARRAALTLAAAVPESDSAGEMLLADIRDQFDEVDTDRLTSAEIVNALAEREDHPWAEWKFGKAITTSQLARLVRPFGIQPRTIKLPSGKTAKGYLREHFEGVWKSYLPPTPALAPSPRNQEPFMRSERVFDPSAVGNLVADRKLSKATIGAAGYGVTARDAGSLHGAFTPQPDPSLFATPSTPAPAESGPLDGPARSDMLARHWGDPLPSDASEAQ